MIDRLIDTNIVSYFLNHDPMRDAYRALLRGNRAGVSFMTVAELLEGAVRAGWGEGKLGRLRVTLGGMVVIYPDYDVCRIWADIRARRRRRPIAVDDAWIAATSLVYNIPLVTHNPTDFAGIAGLKVLTAAG